MTRFVAPPPVYLYQRPRFPRDSSEDVWTEHRFTWESDAVMAIAGEAAPSMWRMVPPETPPSVWASIFGYAVALPRPAWASGLDWITAWSESADASAMCEAAETLLAPARVVEALASMAALAVPWVGPDEPRFARALMVVREWVQGRASPEAFTEAHRAITHLRGRDRAESYAFTVAYAVMSAARAADTGKPLNARQVPHLMAMGADHDADRMQRDCAELMRAHVHVRDVYNALYKQVARSRAPALGEA